MTNIKFCISTNSEKSQFFNFLTQTKIGQPIVSSNKSFVMREVGKLVYFDQSSNFK